jgi:HD domain
MHPLHLVRRFFRASWPRPPNDADEAWVASVLTPAEFALWSRLPNHDRRYSIRVARQVEGELRGTPDADERWVAVALLHDIGKLDASLSIVGRAVATMAGAVRPATRRSGGRFGRYLRHDVIGAEMLRVAGARAEAASWAAAHHHRDRWPDTGIPTRVAEALEAADNA